MQAEELLCIVRYQVDFKAVVDPGFFDGLVARLEADDFFERQKMDATQIVIGIWRRKAVEVRPLIVAKTRG